MCYPVVIPDTSPVVGAKTKNNQQSISLYDNDGIRRTYVTNKETVDNYLSSYKKSNNSLLAAGCSSFGTILLGITGLELADNSIKNFFKKMNWAKCGALGLGALSLVLIPKAILAYKDCNNAEKAITDSKDV